MNDNRSVHPQNAGVKALCAQMDIQRCRTTIWLYSQCNQRCNHQSMNYNMLGPGLCYAQPNLDFPVLQITPPGSFLCAAQRTRNQEYFCPTYVHPLNTEVRAECAHPNPTPNPGTSVPHIRLFPQCHKGTTSGSKHEANSKTRRELGSPETQSSSSSVADYTMLPATQRTSS